MNSAAPTTRRWKVPRLRWIILAGLAIVGIAWLVSAISGAVAGIDLSGKEDVGVAATLIAAIPPVAGLTRTIVAYANLSVPEDTFDTTTTFSSIADIDVYVSGIRLMAGIEFEADVSNPTTHVTRVSTALVGEDVSIVVWSK